MFFILHRCIRAPDTYVIKADTFKVKNYCFPLTLSVKGSKHLVKYREIPEIYVWTFYFIAISLEL